MYLGCVRRFKAEDVPGKFENIHEPLPSPATQRWRAKYDQIKNQNCREGSQVFGNSIKFIAV